MRTTSGAEQAGPRPVTAWGQGRGVRAWRESSEIPGEDGARTPAGGEGAGGREQRRREERPGAAPFALSDSTLRSPRRTCPSPPGKRSQGSVWIHRPAQSSLPVSLFILPLSTPKVQDPS